MRRLPALIAGIASAAAVLGTGGPSAASSGQTLVELKPWASCSAAAALVGAGGTLIVPELHLYRISDADAGRALPGLRRKGALRLVQPDRPAGTLARLDFADPLVATEWWRRAWLRNRAEL